MASMSEEKQEKSESNEPTKVFSFKVLEGGNCTPKIEEGDPLGEAIREIHEEGAVVIQRRMTFAQRDEYVKKCRSAGIHLKAWGIQ